jgi:exoribonuclease R
MAKFNDKTTNQILGAMRSGTSFERAARAAGVDRTTLWRWLKSGEQDDRDGKRTKHAKFFREFNQADAEVVGRVEQHIVAQSEMDPRAAIWFLSKRAPLIYGNTDAAERAQLQRQVVSEFLEFVESHVSASTFQEVLRVLASYGDAELDAKTLPCPG